MRVIHSAQFEISIDRVPRTYRDRKDLALQSAHERLADGGRDRHRLPVGATITDALKLRPTGLGSDRPDYTAYCGEWGVGRTYQTRGGPDRLVLVDDRQRPDDT